MIKGCAASAAVGVVVKLAPMPSVSITVPVNNASYIAPATLTFNASATVVGDTISKVEYVNGTNVIGTATAPPYTVILNNIEPGNYAVVAKATGSLGGTSTSGIVNLQVLANAAPLVSLTANPSTTSAPATVALSASATDGDGTIARVEFYDGATLLGGVTQAPNIYTWSSVAAGTYKLTAKAFDSQGLHMTSAPVVVTVTDVPAGTQVFYIFSDQINTAREITNTDGAKVWQADPDPFGANLPNENPAGQGQFTYNQRFPGQYFDRETGLHYNYFRDYDPQTGRYVQSDPIGLAGGINTYSYVGSEPLRRVDPLGLVDIYVGGAGDGTTKIVQSWVAENAQAGSKYFEWSQSRELAEYIAGLPSAEPINLYGHSFGGDTAAWAAINAGRPINSLTTLDPVSRFKPDYAKFACAVGEWHNVNAAPSKRNKDDWIATVGGKWGAGPNGRAKSHVDVNVNHGDFPGLIRAVGRRR